MNSMTRWSSRDCTGTNIAQRELDLLTEARAGSSAAFEEIQRFYSPRLYMQIHSITRNREDAEDALQETFLRAFVAINSFQGKSQFSTWLTRIAINSALMAIRRHRCRPEISFEQRAVSGEYVEVFEPVDVALNPEQICVRRQQHASLLRAIERLDPKSRSVVAILLSTDCSLKEAAHSLNVSLAAAKSRLNRARKRLGRSLMGSTHGPETMPSRNM